MVNTKDEIRHFSPRLWEMGWKLLERQAWYFAPEIFALLRSDAPGSNPPPPALHRVAPATATSELPAHIVTAANQKHFNALLAQLHYLRPTQPAGDPLRHALTRHDQWSALLV